MTNPIRWKIRESDPLKIESLAKELGVSKTTARILINRKIEGREAADRFLNSNISHVHNPFLLKDMDKAVARIEAALQKKEKICIYGDYDVDGATSTSLLLCFFREIGNPVEFYIPNRMTEGYSLNASALEKLKQCGVRLIITVDNGIMAHKEALVATRLGIDLIITDHHQVAETLPQAVAVVNPQRKDCEYPFKGICGAGVAFKLIMALRQRLRESGFFEKQPEPNLKKYLDLLAIATVCDVVPLVDENRYFVTEGLRVLACTTRPGLKALLSVSKVGDSPTAVDLGFRLGPRINACGRLEDASLGVLLLTSVDASESQRLARELDALNLDRRDIELQIVTDAVERIEKEVDLGRCLGLVMYDETWHEGVVGIVASRVVDKFKRPVFILAKNEQGLVKGSGRSVAGVSLIAALRDCEELFEKFGGHEAAAGVTLREENLAAFISRFDAAIQKQMTQSDLREEILVDDMIATAEISDQLMNELKRLEPHGMGNARPVFAASDLTVLSKRIVGEKHLKLKLAGAVPLDAIAFNKALSLDRIQSETGAIFGLEMNCFRDTETIQLVVKEFISPDKKYQI